MDIFSEIKFYVFNISHKLCKTMYPVDSDTDPFDFFTENTVTSNEAVRETSASVFTLIKTIGLTGIAISLLVGGIYFMYGRSGAGKDEAKSHLSIKIIIGILIFAFVFVISQLFGAFKMII